jgi:DNA-binding LytR/AlgR family response regulator
MRCVIIDDEPLAIEVVESYVNTIGGIEIVATCTNPLEAIRILNKHKVDLVFLDIEMPNLTGIDLVKSIDHVPQFIFTTAYPKYALEGFNLHATDYLLKPIPFPRFLKAVSRAREKYELENRGKETPVAITKPEVESGDNFIFVRSEYENIKINLNEIRYIEGLKDYIKLHLQHTSKAVLTLSNFKDIQEKLPPLRFLRVHRSYVVNIDYITAIQKTKLVLGDTRIPIGETYKPQVLNRLKI